MKASALEGQGGLGGMVLAKEKSCSVGGVRSRAVGMLRGVLGWCEKEHFASVPVAGTTSDLTPGTISYWSGSTTEYLLLIATKVYICQWR